MTGETKIWQKFATISFFLTIQISPGWMIANESIQRLSVDIKSSSSYIAGVVEFKPFLIPFNVNQNLKDYKSILTSSDADNLDIIVFPESSLNDIESSVFVPDPEKLITPCNNELFYDENILSEISCIAQTRKLYIIINLVEKSECTKDTQDERPCAPNGLNQYNTNVVFNRNGTVISRYRKWNLFGELGKNTTVNPEYGTFDTDFGVKFGHFICFDILFNTPGQELVENGITDFIFPTQWFSELPFLTAVQIQSAWSYANDVNLLAAGYSDPENGSTGTGIYSGRDGTLVSVMNSDNGETKLYKANVTKKTEINGNKKITHNLHPLSQKHMISSTMVLNDYNDPLFVSNSNIKLLKDNVTVYKTSLLTNSTDEKICSDDICCEFSVILKTPVINSSTTFQYRLAVYSGSRTYSGYRDGWFKTCAIIACIDTSQETCGILFTPDGRIADSVTFENISITATLSTTDKVLIMPNSLTTSLLPIGVNDFSFDIKDSGDSSRIINYQLKKAQNNLLTFGIYANVLDKSSASINLLNTSMLMIMISFILIWN